MAKPTLAKHEALKMLGAYRKDPVLFVRKVLGAEPTEQQIQLLQAVAPPGARVSVRSGHGTGKTTSLAWIILWHVSLYGDCKVPCTAPTAHQLQDLLWPEARKWADKAHVFFRSQILFSAERIWIEGAREMQFAVARTARSDAPEALQGFHAESLLFVIDEASGVPEQVFEVAEGALSTPGARVVMCANPTRTDGYFYRSHHQERKDWVCLHFSCLDSPRVDQAYIDRMRGRYGEDSSIYRVRVLGDFPLASDDVLIPLYEVEGAIARDVQFPAERKIAGLDVARFGDDATALVVRQGGAVIRMDQWRNLDLMQTVGKVKSLYDDKQFSLVAVDSIGLGAGVVDRLREMQVPTVGVNVAEASSQSEKFMRLRDQLWWACRQFFVERQSRIDPDLELRDDLIGELTGIRYNFTSNGKIKVEGKDEMKKRGLTSPNLADALCLTFAQGVSDAHTGTVKARKVVVKSAQGWT
jgi:hypothetical protein